MVFDLGDLAPEERKVAESALSRMDFPFDTDPSWQAHVAEFGPHQIDPSDFGSKNSYNRFTLIVYLALLGTFGLTPKKLKQNVAHELGHSDDIIFLVPNNKRAEALEVLGFDPGTPWAFRHRPKNYYDEPQEAYARAFQYAYLKGRVPKSWKKRARNLRAWRTPELEIPKRLKKGG